MKRPNLVYVFADQLRASALGYAGNGQAVTPNLDAFARQGVNFRQAVSTYPVCAPYRASLFTGKYPTSHGMVINELRLSPHQSCLGHALTEGSYHTAYIGKWHLYANEFGNHDDPANSFVPRGPHRLGFDGDWMAYGFHHLNYGGYYFTETPEKHFYGEGVYEPEGQLRLAEGVLRRAAGRDEPFALFLSWGPPHDPWGPDNVPGRFYDLFRDESFPNPPNYKPHDDLYADAWAHLGEEDRASLEAWRRGYYAQTASVDACFGELLRLLEEAGVADDTLVVFTSDHGEMLGAQGRRAKSIFYEEACRVPLLMRLPGRIGAGTVSDACLGTVDLMPTLLGLLGLPIPPGVEGMDLSPLAWGQAGPEPRAAFLQGTGAVAVWEDGHEWRAVRDGRYTYAVYRRDGRELLFDHAADPYQLRDLSGSPEHPAALGERRVLLAEFMARIGDTFEASTYYRDHWTDGRRNIVASARGPFGPGTV